MKIKKAVWYLVSMVVGWCTSVSASIDLVVAPAKATRSVDLVTKVHIGAGFFAELRKVVDNMVYFEQSGIKLNSVVVDWTHPFFPYKDDPHMNGWDLYFEPINLAPLADDEPIQRVISSSYFHMLHDQTCTDQWVLYERYLPYRLSMHERIQKYIHIKPEIQRLIDDFYDEHLKGYYCIGVHVRFAAAHNGEKPARISLSHYFLAIDTLLRRRGRKNTKIYVATDSHFVIQAFQKHYPATKLVFIDAFRAQYNEDPHLIYERTAYYLAHPEEFHARKPGYKGGVDALMDCVLLSRCDVMIHSVSNVATFAVLFNPYLQSIFLPRGLAPKPCGYQTQLIASA